MILTVFSTLLYFAERGTWDEILGTFINADGDPTQFSSIPAAAWFVLVTITTVGYGEITPRSFLGRLITLPILVFGLLLITLPSFVLGREFSHVWEKMNWDRKEEEDAGGAAGGRAQSPTAGVREVRLDDRHEHLGPHVLHEYHTPQTITTIRMDPRRSTTPPLCTRRADRIGKDPMWRRRVICRI
jgi:hypothetical protein